jgi:hypothetical protein
MKRLLRGINNKVDKWLHKEEYAQAEQMREAQGGPTPEQMAEMEEALRPVMQFLEEAVKEDMDVAPTERDVARYFYIYENGMKGKKEVMAKMGLWTSDSDEPIMTEEQYTEKAQAGGWKFLRESLGLPLCDLDKPRPNAWRTPPIQPHTLPNSEGWRPADEKDVDTQ